MILQIVLALIAGTLAVPQRGDYYNSNQPYPRPAIPIVAEDNEINPDGSFKYSYTSADGTQVQAEGFQKNPGGKEQAQVIQGSYSYTAPDGTPVTITYIADENGFRAEGSHIPTPPPIPEAIRRSLDLISQQRRDNYQDKDNNNYQDGDNYRPVNNYRKQYYPRNRY